MALYQETANIIAKRISADTYRVGSILPREIDLCSELGVSRNTVRAALSLLERDGIVERKRRGGTRVLNAHRTKSFGLDISSISGIRNYIRNTTANVLSRDERIVPDSLLGIAGLSLGQVWPVVSSIRTVSFSGTPIAAIDIYVRLEFAAVVAKYGSTDDLLSEEIRKRFAVSLGKIEVFLRPDIVGERWSEQLQCEPNLPAINMVEVVRATDNSIIELASMIIPQDRMEFTFTIPAG